METKMSSISMIKSTVYQYVLYCNQSGKYAISYTVVMSAVGGSRSASVRCVINDTEVIGSATTENIQSASINQVWTNFFIVTINSGQTLILQFAANSNGKVTIDFTPPIAGETPISSSIRIDRIL